MAINYSYPKDLVIESADLFLGIRASDNRTVNYTAKAVSNYLNTNAEISISSQLSFRFTTISNIAKTISFPGGLGDGTLFSAITELVVSIIDVSSSNITIYLDYLIDSDILLSQQNEPNNFGHYKITGYTQNGIAPFYTLAVEFIGGNGNIVDDTYYDIAPLNLNQGGGNQNFQQVIDTGNTLSDGAGADMTMTPTGMLFTNTATPGYTYNSFTGFDGFYFMYYGDGVGTNIIFNTTGITFGSASDSTSLGFGSLEVQNALYDTYFLPGKVASFDRATLKSISFLYPASIVSTNKTVQWRDRGGNPAFTDEIPSLTGYATESWVGSNFYPLATNPAGYLTSSALVPYLTATEAALTYYPKPTGTVSQYIDGTGSFQTFPTIPTVGTWGTLNYPDWASGTPFVKMTAAGVFALDTNTYLTSVGTGTASELAYWNSSNSIASLSTALYPSLTELSYVKGVTSAIQTQLSAKQDSLLSAYTVIANNTNATNNGSSQTFKSIANQTYTGTPVWTGTTAPSGATTHTYSWNQIGNLVTVRINLSYVNGGGVITAVTIPLPTDCPAPYVASGGAPSNNRVIAVGSGIMQTSFATSTVPTYVLLKTNSTNTGFDILAQRAAANYQVVTVTVTYLTT